MISKVLLQIEDKDTLAQYRQQTKAYFSKLTPLASFFILCLAISIEVMQRTKLVQSPLLSNITSVVNWASFLVSLGLSFIVRKYYHACMLVGPLMTLYCFYFFCVVDFDGHIHSVYNVILVGVTVTYLLLVFYCETWLCNAIISIPIFVVLLWRQSTQLFLSSKEDVPANVAFRCVFLILVYSASCYQIDRQNKLAFLGKLSNEVTFNRWLKTFVSFPVGIALIRNEAVIYSNAALNKLFNIDILNNFPASGSTSTQEQTQLSIQKHFENCKIKRYVKADRSQPQAIQREITVQEFLQSNKNEGVFEIQPFNFQPTKTLPEVKLTQNAANSEQSLVKQLSSTENKSTTTRRYIQLRQVSVRVGGRNEKLLIVSDESQRVFLEQLMETKEQMQEFTDAMVQQLDDCAMITSETLKALDDRITPECRPMVDDCSFEMKKMRYRIRDYRDVYDIAGNDFSEPSKILINLGSCLKEVQNAVQNDLIRQGVEVSIAINETCPKMIPADNDLFIQVLINLLQQTVSAVGGRGFIKINTYKKQINLQSNLVIDFDASKFTSDRQMAVNIINLAQETDLRKVLSAEVDLNFKIAKILCNKLGWRIEFNAFTASRYSLFVPLINLKSVETQSQQLRREDEESNVQEEEKESSNNARPTTSLPMRSFASKPGSKANDKYSTSKHQQYYYKDNYEQLDQVDEGTRPYSAQVPHLTSTNFHSKNSIIKSVKEDPVMENDLDSPTIQNSTRTLGMDSVARAKLRGYHSQQQAQLDNCLLMNFTEVQLFHEAQLKCHETFTETDALKRIKNSLDTPTHFKYFFIEMEELARVNLKFLVGAIRAAYQQHAKCEQLPKVMIIVLMGSEDEGIIEECLKLEIICSLKPGSQAALKTLMGMSAEQTGPTLQGTVVTTGIQNTTEM